MRKDKRLFTKLLTVFALLLLSVTFIYPKFLTKVKAESEVLLKDGNYARWIDRLDFKGESYPMDFYDWLIENSDNDGENDALIDLSVDFYEALVINETVSYDDGEQSAKEVVEKIYKENYLKVSEVLKTVYAAFNRDYPEVFWLSGSFVTETSIQYEYTNDSITYDQSIKVVIHKDPDEDYPQGVDVRLPAYADGTLDLKNEITAVEKAVADILAGANSCITDYEKVAYFNDWLTKNNCYAENITDDCRNSRSALLGHDGKSRYAPVCEGYARAFKLLCDRAEIPCTIVNGVSNGEGHMWNYVRMENGKWYGVDVTWNDPVVNGVSAKISNAESQKYLLVGASTLVGDNTFGQSHFVENTVYASGIAFTNGPVLNDTAYGKEEKIGEWDVSKNEDETVIATLYEYINDLHITAYKLIILGVGEIKDFTVTPWADKITQISEVSISEQIIEIGENTLAGAINLQWLEILNPQTVVKETAFLGCVNLTVKAHLNSYININKDSIGISVESACVYGETHYEWKLDELVCVASKTCPSCHHAVNETAELVVTGEGEYGCSEEYKTVYTATFDNSDFETAVKKVVGKVKEHSPSDELYYNENGHFNKCECGHEVNFTAHEFSDWEVIESPTEIKDGAEKAICKCGYEKERKINRLGAFNNDDAKKKGIILIVVAVFLIVGVISMRKRKV